MKNILLLLAVILAVQQLPAQVTDDIHGSVVQDSDVSYAPLSLFTNGAGRIFTLRDGLFLLRDGQMLKTGRKYSMVAVPDRGFVFSSWQPVTVFTFIEYTKDPSGTITERTNTDVITTPEYIKDPLLRFTMEPEQVLLDIPNVRSITQSAGWQANFVSVKKPIHWTDSR